LKFKKSGKRMSKRIRVRVNDAVAMLKGVGWLKPSVYEVETTQCVTLELDKIQDFIMRNFQELIQRFDIHEAVILMGPTEFRALSGSMVNCPMRFSLADFQVGHLQNQFHGMSLVVLPWMEGAILVPKSYFPKMWNDCMGRTDLEEED